MRVPPGVARAVTGSRRRYAARSRVAAQPRPRLSDPLPDSEFVQCALLERCPGRQQPNGAGVDVLPVGGGTGVDGSA